ncbi:MAG: Gfo/Idh/MocA family oxidoreductase [Candidatus Gracilibacteria bacterium]
MLKDILHITFNLDEIADTVSEGIRFLKEHGLHSAEIRTIDGRNIAKLSLEETLSLKKILSENSISVAAIASPLFKWYSGSPQTEQKVDLFGMSPYLSIDEKKEMIVKIIEQAIILETKNIRIFSGLKSTEEYEPLPEEESELLLFALKIAKEKDVILMLENEPVCYISRLDDYISMFTSGKYEGLQSWFDIANIYQEGELITAEDLEILIPFVKYLHIKDPIGSKMHKYVPLGKGYINYKRIFDILEKLITEPVALSIETHVKNDKWNASSESFYYLKRLLSTKRTAYAIVGVGRISQKHFTALKSNDNCTLVGVFDIDRTKAHSAMLEYDCVDYSSYEELLLDKQVEVISICCPHDIHIPYATLALKNNKKVLCEKPLALNSNELYRFIENTDKPDSTYVVFQNRFNPAIKDFYEFEKNKLGTTQYIAMTLRWWRDEYYYKDWHGSKEISGGPLITQAIHSLELVTHLTRGAGIKKINAIQLKTRDYITLSDIIIATIEFENGVICNIEVCLATHNQNLESSIFVVGTTGSMKISGVALSEFVYPEVEKTLNNESTEHYYGNGHIALYRTHSNHYLKSFDHDDKLLTAPKDLLETLKLIEAIENALSTSSNIK